MEMATQKRIIFTCIIFISLIGVANAETITVSKDIQAAIDSASSGDTILIPAGAYDINTPIVSHGKELNIEGQGDTTLNIDTGSQAGLKLSGTRISETSLVSDAQKGDTSISLTDASKVKAEDIIQIWKSEKWCPNDYPDQTTGELYKVESVSGNTVTLNEPLLRDYAASDTQIEISRPVEVNVKNIRFINQDGSGVYEGITLSRCIDSSVENCYFKDNGQRAIGLFTCFNINVKNNEIYNCVKSGMGYGVSIADACAYVTVEGNHIENCRHCIMSGTSDYKALNRNVVITENTLIGGNIPGSWVVDAHPNTIDYTVTKNKIYPQDGFISFDDGTQYSVFSGNEIHGGKGGVAKRGTLEDVTKIISDNTLDAGCLYLGTAEGGSGNILEVSGNSLKNGWYGVGLSTEGYEKIIIRDNVFEGLSEQAVKVTCSIDSDFEISGNTFEDISTAISIKGNSKDVSAILKDNKFEDVRREASLDDIESSSSGAIDVDSGNSRNWKDLLDIIEVTGCDGKGDQEQINEALKNATEGSTVFLPSGEYWVDDSIEFSCEGVTLKGEDGTVIRVSKTDRQWFSGFNGIIKSEFSDTTIENIEIDGNCDELDNSLANSRSDTRHDCERAIVVQGSSSNFLENIIIKNVQIENCFSDGAHIRFAENVQVINSVFSNCQHDSIYFVCVRNGLMKNNEIAGITADCIRFDNCEKCKATENTLFSYSGSESNGAYQHGENGFQVGDQGYSYGGGSDKSHIISTNNIEICDNKIINCGLEAILVDAAGKGDYENIYVHDNEIVGDEEFETSGIPVEVLEEIEEVENGKTPSVETSKRVFDSIFDILIVKSYLQVGVNDTVVLPEGMMESRGNALGTIEYQTIGNNTTTVIKIPDKYLEGVSEVRYNVNGIESVHTLMIGERTKNGIIFTESSIWEGGYSHNGNALIVHDRIDAQDIEVTIITPTDSFEPVLEVVEIEVEPLFIHPGIIFILINVVVCILYILFLLRNTV